MKISSDENLIKREIKTMKALQKPVLEKGKISFKKSENEEGKLIYIILPKIQNTISKYLVKN